MTAKKRTAKPNIRPDWMKKSPKVSKEYAEKRAQIVREWDTWPKATPAQARRADKRLEIVFIRNGRDEEKRARTLKKIEALNIPKRLRPEVERVRKYMAGGFHDPVAVASVAAFFLGVELQGLFPEFRGQIAGRKSGANANKRKAYEWKEYAREQFNALGDMPRYRKVKEAIKRTRFKYAIPKKWSKRKGELIQWPSKHIQSDIFKGMK